MSKSKTITQHELLMEYYKKHPNRPIPHPEVVDWAINEWTLRTGKVFRDPDRGIRKLAQEGRLIKVRKGLYKYDPNFEQSKELFYFSEKQKREILERDKYRCVICGLGENAGFELHVDHIKPIDLGGKNTIENGQTLCSVHNFRKNNYEQTESGKKMFIRLYKLAKIRDDKILVDFCSDVLRVFEEHDINGHIEWEK